MSKLQIHMATQCIYTIMNKIYRLVVFCLFFLNLSYAMDDYSACVRSCTDLNNPQALNTKLITIQLYANYAMLLKWLLQAG